MHNIVKGLEELAVAIDKPKLDMANARTGHAFDKIALSLDQYGQRKPIVVNRRTGLTEAGNGTLTAARKLGWSHIAVVYVDDDPNTATGYALADNRLTDISRFDDRALLASLQSLDTVADVPGFSQDDMTDLLKKAEQDFEATVPRMVTFDSDNDTQAALKALKDVYGVDDVGEVVKRAVKAAQVRAEADAPPDVPPPQKVVEDEPPVDKTEELQDKWQVRAGDVWQLGEHRVICGDCTDEAVVGRLMGGEVADLMVTDPPYGVKRDKGFGGSGGFSSPIPRRKYSDDWDAERPSKKVFENLLSVSKNVFIFGGNFFADILPQGEHWIVWDKENTMPTFGDCELVWTNIDRKSVKKITVVYNGLIGKEQNRYHPTQKPVKIIAEILSNYSKDSDLVMDAYLGSGTTLIACEQLNRKCYGIEIEPKYVAVILERWSTLTGNEPTKPT